MRQIFFNTIFLVFAALTTYSQNLPFNKSHLYTIKQLDEKEIPWPARGKFLVTKILITPNIYLWEGDSIRSSFQEGSVTDLGRYLIDRFEIDTLANLYVKEEKLFIVYGPLLTNKVFLDSCRGIPTQPLFKPSNIRAIGFIYEIPLTIKGDKELAKSLFISPENIFVIDRNLEVALKEGTYSIYHVKIEADMTHFESRNDPEKLIPIFR